MDKMKRRVAENMKRIMRARKIKWRDLAEMIGLPITSVRAWIDPRKHGIASCTVINIARALDVDMADLVRPTEER